LKKTILFVCVLFSINFASAFNVASYNIRNFGNPPWDGDTDLAELTRVLNSFEFDLLSVVEIYDKEKFEDYIHDNFPQYEVSIGNCGGGNGQKLGFIYNKNRLLLMETYDDLRTTEYYSDVYYCDSGSRPVTVGMFHDAILGQNFTAMVVHFKSGGGSNNLKKRYIQYDKLNDIMSELRAEGHENFIVSGDFNTTEYTKHGEPYRIFMDLVHSNDLADMADLVECTSYWWGGVNDGLQYPSLLDHVLVSNEFMIDNFSDFDVKVKAHCEQTQCLPTKEWQLGNTFEGVSDHCPLVVEFAE
jgi:endonuclease/exonuclease/phosphatase family metal-dependent hydrolase